MTNYLGPDRFGLYSYVISFSGLFTVIASLGIESILVRNLVTSPEHRDEILGTSFALKIAGACISLFLIGVSLFFIPQDSETTVLIFLAAVGVLFQAANVVDFYYQSKVMSKYSVIVLSSSFTVSSIIKLVLISMHASLLLFVLVTTLEFVFQAVGYMVVYKALGLHLFEWKIRWHIAKPLLKDSWPLIFSGIVISIYMKIDQVMIKQMMGEAEVGYYAAAVRLCEAWYFFPMVVVSSVFPAIMNARNTAKELYMSRLQKLYDLLGGTSVLIAIVVTIFSTTIIKILYTPEYLPAAPVLTIYIWAGVATFLGVASSQYLIAENYTTLSFYRTFAGMVVNIAMNLMFIPRYGIQGAAFATLVSYSVATFSLGFSKKTREQFVMMSKSVIFFYPLKNLFQRWRFHSEAK
jgi:O-antigen/teichoic acid export membrane protein